MSSDNNYEVGKGRPPKEWRFKKGGASPNPSGRPRKKPAEVGEIVSVLGDRVSVTVGGKRRNVTARTAILMKMRAAALAGNIGAATKLFEIEEADRKYREQVLARRKTQDDGESVSFHIMDWLMPSEKMVLRQGEFSLFTEEIGPGYYRLQDWAADAYKYYLREFKGTPKEPGCRLPWTLVSCRHCNGIVPDMVSEPLKGSRAFQQNHSYDPPPEWPKSRKS